MKAKFSNSWKSSVQPRKQRKFVANAPLHTRKNQMSVHLSEELRKKYAKRSCLVKKGDKVRILRGNYKGKEGRVERVSYKNYFVNVANATYPKPDGNTSFYPIDPSNLLIIDLDITDTKRKNALERK